MDCFCEVSGIAMVMKETQVCALMKSLINNDGWDTFIHDGWDTLCLSAIS